MVLGFGCCSSLILYMVHLNTKMVIGFGCCSSLILYMAHLDTKMVLGFGCCVSLILSVILSVILFSISPHSCLYSFHSLSWIDSQFNLDCFTVYNVYSIQLSNVSQNDDLWRLYIKLWQTTNVQQNVDVQQTVNVLFLFQLSIHRLYKVTSL